MGQYWLDYSAVHRSALLEQSHCAVWRTLKFVFKALMASISASVKSNEVQPRLDRSLSLLFVLGMTAIPFCVAQRRRTWPGSVHTLSSSHALHEVRQTFTMGVGNLDDRILFKQGFHISFEAHLQVALRTKRRVSGYGDTKRLGDLKQRFLGQIRV